MKILAYGEDALTLWALQHRLPLILETLDDPSDPAGCTVFYRPSFGRGGLGKANFGEFDFILLADETVYLGESKWDRLTGHFSASTFDLADVQTRRHSLMRFYIEEWAYGDYGNWDEFVEKGEQKLDDMGIEKPVAPADSDLRSNLEQILTVIRHKYDKTPMVVNVFLFLHRGVKPDKIPTRASGDFAVVPIDCSQHLEGNYIQLQS